MLWFPYSQPSIAMMPHTTADHYHQHYRLRRHHHHSLHTESWRLFLHIENGGKQTKNKTNSDDMDRWTDIGHIQTDRQTDELIPRSTLHFCNNHCKCECFFFLLFFFLFRFFSQFSYGCMSVCLCMYVCWCRCCA